jgi:hypothetical protein
MPRQIPISAKRFARRKVVMLDGTIPKATLLPFFNAEGKTQAVLLVDPQSTDLKMFWEPSRIAVPWWGAIRVDDYPEEVTEDDLEELARLWHFDMWRLLADKPYADNELTETLKATNSVGQWRAPVKNLWYAGDLSRVRWVTVKGSDSDSIQAFSTEALPETRPLLKTKSASRQSGWELIPFWQAAKSARQDSD